MNTHESYLSIKIKMFCDLKTTFLFFFLNIPKAFFTFVQRNTNIQHSIKYCKERNRLFPPPRVTKVNSEDLNCNCIRYKIHATVLISAIKESRNIHAGQNAGHGNKGDVKISLKQ